MDFQGLALEVGAVKAGLSPVVPRVLKGDSGVLHRFDLVFEDGRRTFAFDFYARVTEVEVVRSFAKKYDTGSFVNIVCQGEVTQKGRELAVEYGMRILGPGAAETFFSLERAAPREALR